jgi:hypothetical protein
VVVMFEESERECVGVGVMGCGGIEVGDDFCRLGRVGVGGVFEWYLLQLAGSLRKKVDSS